MNKAIEKELKLSKKQNKDDRYNYLCSQFNGIEYAMKLEKYTNKLLKENTQLKKQLKDKDEKISKAIEYIKNEVDYFNGEIEDDIDNIPFRYVMESDIKDVLQIIKGEDK